jgi:hypothetical protein
VYFSEYSILDAMLIVVGLFKLANRQPAFFAQCKRSLSRTFPLPLESGACTVRLFSFNFAFPLTPGFFWVPQSLSLAAAPRHFVHQ